MHFVRGKSGGYTHGFVVCFLDLWELNVQASLLIVADHGEHEGHGMVDALGIVVGTRGAEACDNFVDAEAAVLG